MEKENIGIVVILGIIAIIAFGGAKNLKNPSPISPSQNQAQNQADVEQKIVQTKNQVEELKKQLQIEEDKKYQSKYYGMVKIQYINRADKPENEYLALHVNDNFKDIVQISGWQIKSLSTGSVASIPSGTQLYFSGSTNSESPIILYPGDNFYVITGVSPIGYSFRVNKCSGYLSQFQTFIPYLYTNCPRPADEDLSSIPKLVINEECLDYINSYPNCSIRTDPLPKNWSAECNKFIYEKINYSSCVNTHKSDSDFYQKDWRVYLKRSDTLWKSRRENIVLYDSEGKIVDSLKY